MACGYNSSSAQRGKAGSSGWSSPNKSQLVAGPGEPFGRFVDESQKWLIREQAEESQTPAEGYDAAALGRCPGNLYVKRDSFAW